MDIATILLLVYIAVFYALWTWRPWAAWAWSVAFPLLVVVYSCCYVSGEAAQWEEDNLGIRRS